MTKDPVSALFPAQPLRKDAEQNRQRLLDAAGQLLRTVPHNASMPAIAKIAQVSPATAYRFFPSLEILLSSYLHGVVIQLRDFSHRQPQDGAELFDYVASEWLRLVEIYGETMVQLRSRQGLLERLHADEVVITTVREAWERPIRAVLRSENIAQEHFEGALLIYNVLFDPREVLDLRRAGLDPGEVRIRLTATFKSALHGWASTS